MDESRAKSSRNDHVADSEGASDDFYAGIHNNASDSNIDSEPKCKISRPSPVFEPIKDVTFNQLYALKEFLEKIKEGWDADEKEDFKDSLSSVELYRDPYHVCLLPEFLQNTTICKALVEEMVHKVSWSHKQMDLYEFYQSRDLSDMVECGLLTRFLHMLQDTVRPWLEQVTGLKLDYVSAACSMYICGNYLLVHDDLLKDRQIAFVYYLSPWENAGEWNEKQGGCLEIFNSDDCCLPQFPVKRKIPPKNNQFVFFKVGCRSFHQVGEVTSFDYPRLTINGWFHGASNEDLIADLPQPFTKLEFKQPIATPRINLGKFLNEVYIKPQTRKNIQKHIEDNSEISLHEFLRHEVFEQALTQLLNDDTLRWRLVGPANEHKFEVLEQDTAKNTIADLIKLFSSSEVFQLLHDYTDLDLAGANAVDPTFNLQVQRWTHGNYIMIGDWAICEKSSLDLIYYLNASEGAGIVKYLSPQAGNVSQEEPDEHMDNRDEEEEDDSVLLTITPIDNALNIVYRCEGTTKFTKYISRNTPMEKGPLFVISCSYKE